MDIYQWTLNVTEIWKKGDVRHFSRAGTGYFQSTIRPFAGKFFESFHLPNLRNKKMDKNFCCS
jgi:hypothetical protein